MISIDKRIFPKYQIYPHDFNISYFSSAECRAQLLSDIVTECSQMRGNKNTITSTFVLVKVETTWKSGRGRNIANVVSGPDYFSDVVDSCQVILKVPENQGRKNTYNRVKFFPHDIFCLVPVDKKDLVENLLFRSNPAGGGRHEDSNSNVFKYACMVGHTESHRSQVDGLILKVSKRKWSQVGTGKPGGREMYLLRIGSNITALRGTLYIIFLFFRVPRFLSQCNYISLSLHFHPFIKRIHGISKC